MWVCGHSFPCGHHENLKTYHGPLQLRNPFCSDIHFTRNMADTDRAGAEDLLERLPETSLLSACSKPIDSTIAFQQLIRVDLCMASHSSPFPLGPGCAQENSLILESNSAPGTRTWTWFSLLVIPCGWRTWSHQLISVSQSQTLLLTRPPALRLKSGEREWCKQSHTFPLY